VSTHHKNLTQERWNSFCITAQILNIASELTRARNRLPDNNEDCQRSLERVLELIDYTIEDREKWNRGRLKELLRFRDLIAERYVLERFDREELNRLIKVLLRMHASTASVVA
jgi:hypothetical protein